MFNRAGESCGVRRIDTFTLYSGRRVRESKVKSKSSGECVDKKCGVEDVDCKLEKFGVPNAHNCFYYWLFGTLCGSCLSRCFEF